MYDILIVGAGPAGITAAIYAARRKFNILVLTKNVGGQAAWSGDIENYPGYQLITGPDLAKKFEDHLNKYKIDFRQNVEVTCIHKTEDFFTVKTKDEEFKAKTVIMATGRAPRTLGVKGELEFKNRGVAYCATCDAPLFTKKDVAVIGGGMAAVDATMQLMPVANKIYFVTINNEIIGETVMIEKVKAAQNVEIIYNAKTMEISGEKFVSSVKILVDNSKERILPVKGVFIEIGSIPVLYPSQCGKIAADDNMQVIVNENCETNIPSFFAAGDVTNVPVKQVIVAAGQGCIASMSAFKYLSRLKPE